MGLMAEFKDKIREVYASGGAYLILIIKFALALFTFMQIKGSLGQFTLLNNLFILLLLSLLCAIMPWSMIAVLSGILVFLHSMSIGYETGAFVLVTFLLMGILALRFCGKKAVLLVLVPLAFKANMPLLLPLIAGLSMSSSAALAVACGSFISGLVSFISVNAGTLKFTNAADVPIKMQLLMKGTLQDSQVILAVVVTALVTLFVYRLRRFSVDHSWDLAIILGSAAYVVLTVLGGGLLQVNISLPPLVAGTLGSLFIAYFVKFFLFHVDYKRVARLQFEDDDYYYYVKAIPKIKGKNAAFEERKVWQNEEEDGGEDLSKTRDFSKDLTGQRGLEDEDYEEVDFESKLEKTLKDF